MQSVELSPKEIAKDNVIKALLANLNAISRHTRWSSEHPFVIEYIQKMDEPHRHYHDWTHISRMLDELNQLPCGFVYQPLHLRAAVLFHDIVCTPCSQDNEEQSAMFAARFYRAGSIQTNSDLIIAIRHTFPFRHFDDDRDVMCDLDLSILGAEDRIFDLYRINIAQEYCEYTTLDEFDRGTRGFFEKLLAQSRRHFIYRTEIFRERYEKQARKNIERLLAGYR